MIITGHLLVGGALGVAASALLPSPWALAAAWAVGTVSHHLLDVLPHTDAATFWPHPTKVPRLAAIVVVLEVVLGLALTGTLFLTHHTSPAFMVGAVGGIFPDLLEEAPLLKGYVHRSSWGSALSRWHNFMHCGDMITWWKTGLVIDAAVVGLGLWVLLVMN
jgi:hypothetical protein